MTWGGVSGDGGGPFRLWCPSGWGAEAPQRAVPRGSRRVAPSLATLPGPYSALSSRRYADEVRLPCPGATAGVATLPRLRRPDEFLATLPGLWLPRRGAATLSGRGYPAQV